MALNMFGKNLALEEQGGATEAAPLRPTPRPPRKHIVVLLRARPDITIEIPWCPAHKGVPGN